jgi:hypothetical protein
MGPAADDVQNNVRALLTSFHKGKRADAKWAAKLDPNHKELANTIVLGSRAPAKP